MGGRGRRRTQRKHFKQSRENVWKFNSNSDDPAVAAGGNSGESQADKKKSGWEPFSNKNSDFEDYYKEQGIVAPEEWDTFMEFLRKPLPAAFRINSSGQFCLDIRSQLEDDFVKSLQSEFTVEDEAEALRPLPWYPENFAWHSNFSRNQLRKNQTLARFHEFLKLGNEIGNITRQEAVSMVPPLFLDVRADHSVLDMCAAPGSKTFQLLEIIHRSNQLGSLPSGMIVANDVDVQRSNLLIHQMKRMCTANLIVTNHEAQDFPGCRLSKFHHNSSDLKLTKDLSINQLLFDRVLCDVPCSGDGTLRKAPDIWKKWTVGMGNGVHSLQIKIALRGVSLLKVGGRMVYSTCSMNPVENEAVVAEILRKCGDSVELLDVSKEFPQLIRRPGLKRWKVRDKSIWLSSYEDVPEDRRAAFLSSMFSSERNVAAGSSESSGGHDMAEAPTNGGDLEAEFVAPPTTNDVSPTEVNEDNVCTLPLERCMRIVPHDQNTGAFFVAVFHKRSPFPVIQEQTTGVNGCLPHKDEERDEATRDKLDESAGKLDDVLDAKPNNSTPGTAHAVDKKTDEGSLDKNEPGETLEDDVLEGQAFGRNNESGPDKVGAKRKLPSQGKWKGVDPVTLFKDEIIISNIKSFYGIDDSFPLYGHLVSRNSDTNSVKRIYYISKSVKDVLELNFLAGQQLKMASVGLKMFERQTSKDGNSSPCRFRISSEGLPLLLPHITKQILFAPYPDFKHLLQYKFIKFGDFVDSELGERASKLELGCCVVVLREAGQPSSVPLRVDSSTITIGCWKGRSNLNVMMTALDCTDLLARLEMRIGTGDLQGDNSCSTGVNEVAGMNVDDADMKEEGTNDPDVKEETEAANTMLET